MLRWLHLVLVAAQLAAGALACPPVQEAPLAPELARAYSANALHAHGGEPTTAAGELRAPCPCGCDEAPASGPSSARLGYALLPAPPAAVLPRACHRSVSLGSLRDVPADSPDPVPRLG